WVVRDVEELQVLGREHRRREPVLAQPVQQPAPVAAAKQDDREVLDLARLSQGQRLEQLVQRPETAWEDYESAGVADEHGLSHKEVPELDTNLDVVVQRLLVGQLDVASNREAAGLHAAAVEGLHHARTAAGYDGYAAPGQSRTDLPAPLVQGICGTDPGRTEACHGRANVGQR